jgi:hypothetical protein
MTTTAVATLSIWRDAQNEMFINDEDNYKGSNNIGCRLLFIFAGTPGSLAKNLSSC